jgi:hypothetical protein
MRRPISSGGSCEDACISDDPELAFLDNQLSDGMPLEESQPQVTPRRADRMNPAYAGWAQLFRKWDSSQAIRDAPKVARDGFSPLFQEYFEGLWTRLDS